MLRVTWLTNLNQKIQLHKQMARLQAEVQNLQMQLVERLTAAKDMLFVFLIPKWSGTEKATPFHEF